ncbi:MAG TPA: IncP-type conjugal transfer protein TraG, partial [Polyangiaceae bacterium]|nr:IncP-type conjugal transfer protein TraG [Polyangiaceae bacterium]
MKIAWTCLVALLCLAALWTSTRTPRHGTAALSILGAAASLVLCGSIAAARSASTPGRAYGTSRWATGKELERGGLLRGEGVVLCQTAEASFRTSIDSRGHSTTQATSFGRLVRHDGPEHVLCFAPTRTGKGAGLVIPTLLAWKHSVLVYDIKKENWTRTAGWRRQFSRTWRFEPTAVDSVRFNPLFEIRRGLVEVKDTQNVADILVDPTGGREMRDHWQATAHSLLVGAILHVLYAEADKTLAGVATFLSDPTRSREDTLHRMLETHHVPSGPHPVVVQTAREMLNKSNPEVSGVFSTALACLSLYRDPVIARNTADSDFRIADLVGSDAPVSLYLVIPPSDLIRTRPLIRLMLNQICRRLTESMGYGATRTSSRRLLLLLDEFPALGRLDFFETSLAFSASYGIKALLIAQSLNQLEKAYGPNNSILDNCHVRVAFASNDERTARRISDALGMATEIRAMRNYAGHRLAPWLAHLMVSRQETARPLLTAGEVMQLPPTDAIVMLSGAPPIRAQKLLYYKDPLFRGRVLPPPALSVSAPYADRPPARPDDWGNAVIAPTES